MNLKQLLGNDDERAVSPVIGVILMVAITVILAAVIAAFVIDLGQSTGANPQAGFTIDYDEDSSTAVVTVTSIERLDTIGANCDSRPGTLEEKQVGETIDAGDCDPDDVVVVGSYDGNEAVLS